MSTTGLKYFSMYHVLREKRSRRRRSIPSPNLEKVAKHLSIESAVKMDNIILDSEDVSLLLKDIYLKLRYGKAG